MKNNTSKLQIRRCVVCGFPFADEHHLRQGLWRAESPIALLCPNHHRLVHIVYSIVERGFSKQSIESFRRLCDPEFAHPWLDRFSQEHEIFWQYSLEHHLGGVLAVLWNNEVRLYHKPYKDLPTDLDLMAGEWWGLSFGDGKLYGIYDALADTTRPIDGSRLRPAFERGYLTITCRDPLKPYFADITVAGRWHVEHSSEQAIGNVHIWEW